jgi:hypothetical protein
MATPLPLEDLPLRALPLEDLLSLNVVAVLHRLLLALRLLRQADPLLLLAPVHPVNPLPEVPLLVAGEPQ